jgi:hypothetical protein
MVISQFKTDYGYIDYCTIYSATYSQDVLVFMGSYIFKEHRRKGMFKQMVLDLFSKFKSGTIVQVPVKNKFISNMFKKMGFYEVERIEYWQKLSNAILLEGKLN